MKGNYISRSPGITLSWQHNQSYSSSPSTKSFLNALNHVIPNPNTSQEICLHQDNKYRSNIHKYNSFSLSSFGDAVFDVMQHASSEIMDNLNSNLGFKTIVDIKMNKDDTLDVSNRTGSQTKICLNIGKTKF